MHAFCVFQAHLDVHLKREEEEQKLQQEKTSKKETKKAKKKELEEDVIEDEWVGGGALEFFKIHFYVRVCNNIIFFVVVMVCDHKSELWKIPIFDFLFDIESGFEIGLNECHIRDQFSDPKNPKKHVSRLLKHAQKGGRGGTI